MSIDPTKCPACNHPKHYGKARCGHLPDRDEARAEVERNDQAYLATLERALAAERARDEALAALRGLLDFVQQQRALGNVKGPVEVCVRARRVLAPRGQP